MCKQYNTVVTFIKVITNTGYYFCLLIRAYKYIDRLCSKRYKNGNLHSPREITGVRIKCTLQN